MNLNDYLELIDKHHSDQESKDIKLLDQIAAIDWQQVYTACAEMLFKLERHNYPKDELSDLEKKIHSRHKAFIEGIFFEETPLRRYTATFYGVPLIKKPERPTGEIIKESDEKKRKNR